MKIRSSRISASIAKAICRRHGTTKRSILKAILSFFALFKLVLSRHRPVDFVALRSEVWRLDEEEYTSSFQERQEPSPAQKGQEAQLVPIGDLGYSGSTFFTTPNAKYLVKSLPRRFEHDFFARELLDPYIAHVKHQPHSLLVRITDLVYAPHASVGGILGAAPTHHIVMENLLYGRPEDDNTWEMYDLKPNDYFFPERDIADGALAPDSVIDRLVDEFPDKVRVSHEAKQELISLLFADSALLANRNAVDYSLFLVRYPRQNSGSVPTVNSDAGIWRRGVDDVEGKWTYRCVVLDFFWAKHTFHARALTKVVKVFNKVAHKGPMSITADPTEYRERFMKMVDEMVVEG
ncbi:hypothetical protein ACJ41O_007688 [Fusarium nematophilum]